MKTLVTYLSESLGRNSKWKTWEDYENFSALATEIKEENRSRIFSKYFNEVIHSQVGATSKSIHITLNTGKGENNVQDSLKKLLESTKSYKKCANHLYCSAYLYEEKKNEYKYAIYIDYEDVYEKKFEKRKQALKSDGGKIVMEPCKL